MLTQKQIKYIQIIFIVLTVLCMAVIFAWSARPSTESYDQSFAISTKFSSVVQESGAEGLKDAVLSMSAEDLDWIFRKGAHILEFAGLGFLLVGSFVIGRGHKKRGTAISTVVGILYACSDELHQLFVPGRGAKISDVCFDSLGVVFGVAFFLICLVVLNCVLKTAKSGA